MKIYFFYKPRVIRAVRATSIEQAQAIMKDLNLKGYILLSIMPTVSVWSIVIPNKDPEVNALPYTESADDENEKPQPCTVEA